MNGAQVVLSTKALKGNLAEVKRLLGPDRFFYAVVKTEAYGHGIVEIGSMLYKYGQRHFAVSTVEEGVTLREAGGVDRDAEVLTLGPLDKWDWKTASEYGLTVTLNDIEDVAMLKETVCKGNPVKAHLKVDVGMRRMGVRVEDLAGLWAKLVDTKLETQVVGMLTHFDSAGSDLRRTMEEWKVFRGAVEAVVGPKASQMTVHCANSAATVALSAVRESAARIGLLLYGFHPRWESDLKLTPVMTVMGRIIMEKRVKEGEGVSYDRRFVAKREMRVGVVNIGYAHGYPWRIVHAEMAVKGHRVPVVGAVTMDYTMIDLTQVAEARKGDFVEVMGPNVRATELAEKSGTIVYDILCNIGRHTRKTIRIEGSASGESENAGGSEGREKVVPGSLRPRVQEGGSENRENQIRD